MRIVHSGFPVFQFSQNNFWIILLSEVYHLQASAGIKTHINISFGEVVFCVVLHQQALIITDERVPVVAEIELTVCATWGWDKPENP